MSDIKLDRGVAKLSLMNADDVDDDYVDAPMHVRLSMVWDITEELWSLTKEGEISVQSRLQRNVTKLTRMQR